MCNKRSSVDLALFNQAEDFRTVTAVKACADKTVI